MPRLFIYGFPGLYGGAGTELHHQIPIWLSLGIDVHIIPVQQGYKNEPLYQEMIDLGITIHEQHKFSVINADDAVINFCSDLFLDNIAHIRQFTKRTIFVNCMTWMFKSEKRCHSNQQIAFSLYQRPQVLEEHETELKLLGSDAEFLHFVPHFNPINVNFDVKDNEQVHIGRISRADPGKYTKFNGHIYGGIVSPKPKVGHFLGFNEKCGKVTGSLPAWIKTYENHRELSVRDFYDTIDLVVQPTNTTENWPRIGFEAMFSGKPLVVDNRGGWQYMIEHGKTGFLCDHERDFMYYGSRLAYDLELRHTIAQNALTKAKELAGFEASKESWSKIFERIFN